MSWVTTEICWYFHYSCCSKHLTSHACALLIDNVGNYLYMYLNNGSFKSEVDPHQFNLRERKKIFKSWQVCDWLAKWLIVLGFMDLRWPRVYRRSNVGLVGFGMTYIRGLMVSSILRMKMYPIIVDSFNEITICCKYSALLVYIYIKILIMCKCNMNIYLNRKFSSLQIKPVPKCCYEIEVSPSTILVIASCYCQQFGDVILQSLAVSLCILDCYVFQYWLLMKWYYPFAHTLSSEMGSEDRNHFLYWLINWRISQPIKLTANVMPWCHNDLNSVTGQHMKAASSGNTEPDFSMQIQWFQL